jgi:hypothetical protein
MVNAMATVHGAQDVVILKHIMQILEAIVR